MISYKELIGSIPINDIDVPTQFNLEELLKRMNIIRKVWGKPMTITSGLRTMHDHLRIYSEMNAKRVKKGLPALKVPVNSQHLYGCAADVLDLDGSLYEWCKTNEGVLEAVGLWLEIKDDKPRVHFQIKPPASGKRFFNP